ncbi:5495_t:CDS:1 [Ambispora gerdemannii]|uniref:5495_t:CDS:1 n=1 Tax=Ambispora gerdemannii TaxID=144530 RepID=A0A9N9BK50_9GLOM|nr:5495_t:CDS:1 [Ambispora gerdemannii]
MAPFLPSDCYNQIFENLENDRDALYSCILVNRQWCQSAIPVLWSQPFRLLNICRDPAEYSPESWRKRAGQLVETYFLSLNEEEKRALKRKRVYLSREITAPPEAKPRPIFDYPHLLRRVDLGEVFAALLGWIEYTQENKMVAMQAHASSSSFMKMDRIAPVNFLMCRYREFRSWRERRMRAELAAAKVLGNFLMKHCWTIKRFSIDTIHRSLVPDALLLMPMYPGAIDCLSNLAELRCTTKSIKTNFFQEISKVARNLRNITVWMSYPRVNAELMLDRRKKSKDEQTFIKEAEALVRVVEAQKSLRAFELGYCPWGLDLVINSLKSQSHSLRRISFTGVNFLYSGPLAGLAACTKLEKLKFNSCLNLTDTVMQPLTNVRFPFLRKINMNSPAPASILTDIIRNSNASIKKLTLSEILQNEGETPSVIEIIAQHCSNIIKCNVRPTKDEMPQLVSLVSLCENLETLIITGARWPEIDVNSVVRDMSKYKLPKLRHLGIQAALTLTPRTLEHFFQNTRAPIVTLEFYQSQCFGDHHLDVVLCCLESTLRNLRVQTYRNIPSQSIHNARQRINSVYIYPM